MTYTDLASYGSSPPCSAFASSYVSLCMHTVPQTQTKQRHCKTQVQHRCNTGATQVQYTTCNTLATHCNTLPQTQHCNTRATQVRHTATHCRRHRQSNITATHLQHTCNTPQHSAADADNTATHCNTLQHTLPHTQTQCVAVCCSMLQCAAVTYSRKWSARSDFSFLFFSRNACAASNAFFFAGVCVCMII